MARRDKNGGVVQQGLDILESKERLSDLTGGLVTTQNAVALGAVGGYLAMVGYHDNGEKLFSELSNEKRFLKFALALVVLNFSIDRFLDNETKVVARGFLWVGLLLSVSNDKIFEKINDYFKG